MATGRLSSAIVTVALVATAVSPVSPVASAQALDTQNTEVTHECALVHRDSALRKGFRLSATPETVVVRYPAAVAPGEIFTAYARPGSMATSNQHGGYAVGRLSYDFAFPTNSTNLEAWMNGPGDGFRNPDSLRVDRIDANGGMNEFGPYARIWGGESAILSTGNEQTIVDAYEAGLRVDAGRTFQFPEVGLRMRAPVTAAGSTIAVGLKGAGASNGSATNGANNTLQGAERAGWTLISFTWTSRFYCNTSAHGAALSSTYVDGSRPRYLAQTSTSMTSAGTHLPRSNRTTTLSARVATDEELMSNVRAGGALMRFDIRDLASGTVIASPTATINPDGTASVAHAFPDISPGEVRDNYEVTATYTGRAGDIASSTSAPTTISVGYNEINATVDLSSTNGQLSNGTMPVTLRATVTPPSGRSFPSNLQIQLYKDDRPHGAPLPVPSGTGTKQITFPVDTLTQQQNTKTYRYRAEIVPLIVNDLDRYAGASAVPVAAIVTGTDPGSTLPEGGQGSVSLEEFFRAPQLVWDWLTGSIGQAGAFSVSFAK